MLKDKKNDIFLPMIKRYEGKEFKRWGREIILDGLPEFEKKLINQYFVTKGKILDLGCGGGREAIVLSREGFEVVGLDFSARMIEVAKQNATKAKMKNIKFITGNICSLPFDEHQFEYAIANQNLINHISPKVNRIHSLKEIKRVLKPTGLLLAVSNSINANWNYKLYFKILNLFRKFYNPAKLEYGDIILGGWGQKIQIFKKTGPIFHWYRGFEFIDDLFASGLKLINFISAEEIEKGGKKLKLREKREIYYVAQA